jgi:hypothetical protein
LLVSAAHTPPKFSELLDMLALVLLLLSKKVASRTNSRPGAVLGTMSMMDAPDAGMLANMLAVLLRPFSTKLSS